MTTEEYINSTIEDVEGEEYISALSSPAQLISALALFLKEKNKEEEKDKEKSYICLYDTSILESLANKVKNVSIENLDSEYLYKCYLFFNGLIKNLELYDNLILISEVIKEMENLIEANLSAINKRKNQYKNLSSKQKVKEKYKIIYKYLIDNEEVLKKIMDILEIKKNIEKERYIFKDILDKLLELTILFDKTLEIKKANSRNDTDNRLVARALYEVIINGKNIVIYTRDEDIRSLVSNLYKFLTSNQLKEEIKKGKKINFLNRLNHLNIIVYKYYYKKKIFKRFFESATLPYNGEFRFYKKLSKSQIKQFLKNIIEILEEIEREIEENKKKNIDINKITTIEKNNTNDEEVKTKIKKILNRIFQSTKELEVSDSLSNFKAKVDILSNLSVLAKIFNYIELYDNIIKIKKESEKVCIENIIKELKEERVNLKKRCDELYSIEDKGIDEWKEMQEIAKAIEENIRKLKFFENCSTLGYYEANLKDYENYRNIIKTFQEYGFNIDKGIINISYEKLSEILNLSLNKIIEIIDKNKIEYTKTHANLKEEDLIFFIFEKKKEELELEGRNYE